MLCCKYYLSSLYQEPVSVGIDKISCAYIEISFSQPSSPESIGSGAAVRYLDWTLAG